MLYSLPTAYLVELTLIIMNFFFHIWILNRGKNILQPLWWCVVLCFAAAHTVTTLPHPPKPKFSNVVKEFTLLFSNTETGTAPGLGLKHSSEYFQKLQYGRVQYPNHKELPWGHNTQFIYDDLYSMAGPTTSSPDAREHRPKVKSSSSLSQIRSIYSVKMERKHSNLY